MANETADDYLELIRRYRELFGETPPLFWQDEPSWQVKQLKKAIDSGERWERPGWDDTPPEEILL
jgi:hypothetical protein